MQRRTSLARFGLTLITLGTLSACSCGGGGGDGPGDGGNQPRDSGMDACTTSLADRVRITDVPVGVGVVSNEDEAGLRPIVISPMPSGGSRIAFMGTDGDVHVVTLDEDDAPTGASVTVPANDFSDLFADDDGFVLLLTRDALAGGSNHCGTVTNLCGPANALPTDASCSDMYLVRYDGATESWATKLTDSSAARPPYLNGPTDAEDVTFIWWYAHHGRIASDGERYAAYYGAAISVSESCWQPSANATGVNIHQGDQMRVVDADGDIVSGGFGWGCSHSGYEFVAWDEAASAFVSVCKTDNQNRLAFAPSYTTIRPVDLAYSNFGGLAITGGHRWLITSDRRDGQPAMANGHADVHLLRVDDGAALDDIIVANEGGENHRAPHIAAYGDSLVLASWESSTATGDLAYGNANRAFWVQLFDATSGDPVGASHEIEGITGNRYHDLRAFPDGSVAFPSRSTSPNTMKVLRILSCP